MVFLKGMSKKEALECLQYAESVVREISEHETCSLELRIGVTEKSGGIMNFNPTNNEVSK